MRIVLDTNVLVAGLLSPFGPCGEIVRMVSSGELALCLDARVIAEYDEVLRRSKFSFNEDHIAALLQYITYRGHMIASSPLPCSLPDIDDEMFLEIAIAGRATCLVTGNQHHFPPALRQDVTVLSPAEFLSIYRQHQELENNT